MSTLANKTVVLLNGYDVSEFLRGAKTSASVDAKEATTFGKSKKVYKAGLGDASADFDALYDQRSALAETHDAIDDILPAALGGPQGIITVVRNGDGFGQVGYGMAADATKYEIAAPVAELVTAAFSVQASGRDRIVVLHDALTAAAASGNGTDHDDGALSTGGGVGYLHCLGLSTVGGDTLTAKVQHSVDGVTWVDLITFAPVTLPHVGQRIEVAAGVTINRHVRAIWTLSAGASATFHVAFARK